MKLLFKIAKIGDFNISEIVKAFENTISYGHLSGVFGVYVKNEKFTGGVEINLLGKMKSADDSITLDSIFKLYRKNFADFAFVFKTYNGLTYTIDVNDVIDLSVDGFQWLHFCVELHHAANTIHTKIENLTAKILKLESLTVDDIYEIHNRIEGVKVNYSIDDFKKLSLDCLEINNFCLGVCEFIPKDLKALLNVDV